MVTPIRDVSGRLEGRVAIVTGGGWNVGQAIARGIAAEGARVVVASRREDRLDESVQLIRDAGGEAIAVPTDVTDLAQVESLVARTITEFGTVDIMAAIAGGGGIFEPVDEIDPADWERCIHTNLFSTFYSARAVLPVMREKNAGIILTCAGGGAFFPMIDVAATAYACAKAAICRFTDQLTAELLDTEIRVNCIEPGHVLSSEKLAAMEAEEARTGSAHPAREYAREPSEAADLAVWLASDESSPLRGRVVSAADSWWKDPEKVWYAHHTEHYYRLRRFTP